MDYAALAAQYGGSPQPDQGGVDYAALAAQYGGAPAMPDTSVAERESLIADGMNPVQNFGVGMLKGVGSTIKGVATLGQMGVDQINKVLPESFQVHNPGLDGSTPEGQRLNQFLAPASMGQYGGYLTEKIGESIIPSSRIASAGGKAGTAAISSAGVLPSLGRGAIMAGTEGLGQFGLGYVQSGGNKDAAEVQGALGAGFSVLAQGFGALFKGAGEKIMNSVIKPSQADIKDGFSMNTITKYDLGGPLHVTMAKTQSVMNDLTQMLRDKLGASTTKIDLNDIFEQTAGDLAGASKLKNFGMNHPIDKALGQLRGEIDGLAGKPPAPPTRIPAVAKQTTTTVTDGPALPPSTRIPGVEKQTTVKMIEGQPLPESTRMPMSSNVTKVPINGKNGSVDLRYPQTPKTPTMFSQETNMVPKYEGATDLRYPEPPKSPPIVTEESALVPQYPDATDLRYPLTFDGTKLSIPDAQTVKQAAGFRGEWEYGRPDPETSALGKVYTVFYEKLKTAIEQSSPEGVREINKQLSELIPVMRAVVRRIPVAERNNLLSLQDILTLTAGAVDPRALAGLGLSLAQKSGTSGNATSKLGGFMPKLSGPTAAGIASFVPNSQQ